MQVQVLTRRDRAACELALSMMHRQCWTRRLTGFPSGVRDVLGFGDEAACRLRGAVYWALSDARKAVDHRLIRARLALYLRALLRAERGEFGPWSRQATGLFCSRVNHHVDIHGRCRVPSCGCYNEHRRITPLWQLAKEAKP